MVTLFDSEREALLSRISQAKTAIERVMDRLDGTFDLALSQALDRLVELREHYEGTAVQCTCNTNVKINLSQCIPRDTTKV